MVQATENNVHVRCKTRYCNREVCHSYLQNVIFQGPLARQGVAQFCVSMTVSVRINIQLDRQLTWTDKTSTPVLSQIEMCLV